MTLQFPNSVLETTRQLAKEPDMADDIADLIAILTTLDQKLMDIPKTFLGYNIQVLNTSNGEKLIILKSTKLLATVAVYPDKPGDLVVANIQKVENK
jgi:hypothetical protein